MSTEYLNVVELYQFCPYVLIDRYLIEAALAVKFEFNSIFVDYQLHDSL